MPTSSEAAGLRIAHETGIDRAAVDALHLVSFPTRAEADLVLTLRARGELSTSLVASVDGAVVGHVAFSPVRVGGAATRATGLGPVAVAPWGRRRGVAAALIEAGLAARRAAGDAIVVVLGEPAYYGRFGFRRASELGLVDTYGGGDAFQALALGGDPAAPPPIASSGSDPGLGAATPAIVRYAAAFDEVPAHPVEPSRRDELALILAVGANGAIGQGGRVPWDLPDDRAHFERTTRGHVVILGRRTWDETGRALPGRTNVVVSRGARDLPGATVVGSLAEALDVARRVDPLPFVIGGRALFEEALPLATRVYLTEVPLAPEADVFVRLDREGLREVGAWTGSHGERYVVLARGPA